MPHTRSHALTNERQEVLQRSNQRLPTALSEAEKQKSPPTPTRSLRAT